MASINPHFCWASRRIPTASHILYYIGDELFAGKWRALKVHFITTEGFVSAKQY